MSTAELAGDLLVSVDANVYQADLDGPASQMHKLRPDVDARSVGGVVDPGFARTPFSRWWNRTHLDYALQPTSPALRPGVGFRASDLAGIGLRGGGGGGAGSFPFAAGLRGRRNPLAAIQSETADRAFGLYLEPSFGVSFPTNKGVLADTAAAAFARYSNVGFSPGAPLAALQLRVRLCLPDPAGGVKPAAALVLRAGSPEDGPLVARVVLDAATLAHRNCGYLIGSYWAPGAMNDDPAAMRELVADLAPTAVATESTDIYLSIEGGGHVALDWFRFERAAPVP